MADRRLSTSSVTATDPRLAPEVERRSGYLPGLDGLRAVAILGVLVAHDQPWSFAGHSDAAWHDLGGWGVDLFFALSGVLICWRLLEDEKKRGSLRLRSFYLRRLFRIQPAAYTYLLAVAVLFLAGSIPVSWPLWWSAVLSYTNFLVSASTPPGAAAFVGHFWTLAVEEHFYLLISLVFLAPQRFRVRLLAGGLLALWAVQTYAEHHGFYAAVHDSRRSYWVLQFLLLPALLAMLVRRPAIRAYAERWLKPWVVVLGAVLAIWVHFAFSSVHVTRQLLQHFDLHYFLFAGSRTLFYAGGFLVIAVMLHPRSWSTRVLELAPLRFLGRLSYSLYLWHVLFFVPGELPVGMCSPLLIKLGTSPWRYLLSAACALGSYLLIEKPMIRLGHHLAPPATAGHADLRATPATRQSRGAS